MDRKDFPAFDEKPIVPVKYSGILQALSGEDSYIEGGYNPIFNDISLNPARVTYEDIYVIPHENEHARQFNYPGDYNSQKAIDISKKSPWYANLKKQGYSDSEIPYEVMAGLEAHRGQRNVKTGEAESSYEHSPYFARLPEDVKTWALGNKYDYQTNQDFLDNIDKYGYNNAMRIERIKHIAGNLKNKIKNFESGGAVNMNYPAKESAQGLASLGRYGDTMLVHMNPEEVAGLQSLAMSKGGSLTINPDTGMPEAFILPMLGGAALSKFMSPMAAGLLIGGATALTSGDIGQGIMAGLGGFGGADLGKIFTKMGTQAVGGMPVGAPVEAVKEGLAQNISMFTPTGTFGNQSMNAALTGSSVGSSAIPGAISPTTIGPGVNSTVNAMGTAPSSTQIAESTLTPPGTYGQMGEGFGKLIKDPFGEGFEAFKVAGGEGGVPLETGEAAMKLGSPIAGAALSLFEPPMPKPYVDPDTGKYRGPQGQLNLSDQFDTGLRLVAKGGYIKGYALGGAVNTNPSVGGGLSDLYNRPEGATTQNLSSDGYGIGRLNNLANEQSRYQAQTLGYAMGGLTALKQGGQPGGYLDGEGDGMSDSIPATIEGKQPARLADGEFVIPADVVSHLGNGSSKAGSKRLYAMLDKVRHARTGTKKQGKEIKADKYLPA